MRKLVKAFANAFFKINVAEENTVIVDTGDQIIFYLDLNKGTFTINSHKGVAEHSLDDLLEPNTFKTNAHLTGTHIN